MPSGLVGCGADHIDLQSRTASRETVSRVTEFLEERGISYESLPHGRTYTAIDEAGELRVAADDVLKTIVLKIHSGYTLATIPASRHLDLNLARDAAGTHGFKLATEGDLERDFARFELSAVPPLPSLLGIPAYVDPQVMLHESVDFAASQTTSIRVRTKDVLGNESVTVVPLIQQLTWAGKPV
jgi:Ala-tRNA(Pro) deacylase